MPIVRRLEPGGSIKRGPIDRRQPAAERLEANRKVIELVVGLATILSRLLNIATHAPLYTVQEAIDFLGGALDDKLNASVWPIPHEPDDLAAGRELPNRVSEPYPLNASRVLDLATLAIQAICPPYHAPSIPQRLQSAWLRVTIA
jgi:hypothetical protein